MPSLIAYRKHIDAIYTHELRLPEGTDGQPAGQELCTLADGRTVVVLFDGYTLPAEQHATIASTIEVLTLTDALRAEIKAASPHVRLINQRVREAIASRYSLADELKLIRTAPRAEMDAYHAWVEKCRAWGRAEKAKLGL